MSSLISRVKSAALLHGDFTLRSGKKSNVYLDVRKVYGDPALLNDLVDNLYSAMNGKEATCVAAYGFGGQPLASVMSSRHGLKLVAIRENVKDHGTGQQIEGYIPNSSDRVIIPDDVFTTGSSLKEVTSIILPTGAKIIKYGVVVNREQGDPKQLPAPLVWLMTAKQVMES